jgi:hypothetical protein
MSDRWYCGVVKQTDKINDLVWQHVDNVEWRRGSHHRFGVFSPFLLNYILQYSNLQSRNGAQSQYPTAEARICWHLSASKYYMQSVVNKTAYALVKLVLVLWERIYIRRRKYNLAFHESNSCVEPLNNYYRNELHGLSPRANYTDRATAASRRSECQLLRIKCATWSAWRIPTVILLFNLIFGYLFIYINICGIRSSVVECGTMLQAGRSWIWFLMKSMDFTIDLIFPVSLWQWV